jgi:hypothetical protein
MTLIEDEEDGAACNLPITDGQEVLVRDAEDRQVLAIDEQLIENCRSAAHHAVDTKWPRAQGTDVRLPTFPGPNSPNPADRCSRFARTELPNIPDHKNVI